MQHIKKHCSESRHPWFNFISLNRINWWLNNWIIFWFKNCLRSSSCWFTLRLFYSVLREGESSLRQFASRRFWNNLCPLLDERRLSVPIRPRVSVSTCVCLSDLWLLMPKLSVWGEAWRDVFIPGRPGWAPRGHPL